MIAALLLSVALPLAAAPQAGGDARRAAPDDPPIGSDIIVIARRGDAAVASESEYDQAAIAARGADSIATLLDRLRPFFDESGEQPEILVNGRPLGLDRSLLSYPPEALERVAVLRREAAARYGQPGDRSVINLVLKERFASVDAEAGVFGPTDGGQTGGLLTARRVAIAGVTRWNATLRAERQGALLRSARDLPPRGTAPLGVDPDDYETLLPSRRNLVGSIGATRPIGIFSGSVTLDASDVGGAGLRGLPPGAGTDLRPLRSSNDARSLGLTASLVGTPGGWQTSLSANLVRSWSDSLIERGGTLGTLRNRARGDSLTARVSINRSLLTLPAGPLTASATLNLLTNRSINRQSGAISDAAGDPPGVDASTRRQIDGSISVGLPLSRRDGAGAGSLGRLSAQLSVGVRALTGAGTRTELGGGLIWSPVSALELRGTVERAGTAPSVDQLNGPLVTIVTRVFDYARQETVEVARLIGGLAGLPRGRRAQMSLSAKLLPFADQRLTLASTYRRQTLTGGVLAFPDLTPAIEAAFPTRVTRGPDGRLLAIDARPIAIAADESAELFSSATLRLSRHSEARPVGGTPSAATPWTLDLSLSDRWRLRDRLFVRDGLPAIDRLADGGQPRHTLSLQMTAARRGFGINLGTTWSTATAVRSGMDTGGGAFRVRSPALFNLDLFVRPHDTTSSSAAHPWYGDTTITLLVQNLLNDYRRVSTAAGSTPMGYSRSEVDPAGRTIRIVARKRF